MRCKKCSYISFDHFSSCPKCHKDLSEASGQFLGTLTTTNPPNFLGSAIQALTDTEELGSSSEEIVFPPSAEPVTEEVSLDLSEENTVEDDIEEEEDAALYDEDEFDFEEDLEDAGDEKIEKINEEFAEETAVQTEEESENPESSEISEVKNNQEEATMFPQSPDDPITLKFEGLDLSDLTPESDSGSEKQDSDDEPVDLWSINDEADEEDGSVSELEIFEKLGSAGHEEDSETEIDIDLDLAGGDAEPEKDQLKAENGDEEASDSDKK